jgi:hypothetical protein
VLLGSTTLGAVGTAATLWLDGGRVLRNGGSFSLASGQIVLGDLPGGGSGGGSIVNAHGATLDIATSGTVIAAGSGSTGITNSGLLDYDGTGEASITAQVTNSGTLALLGGVNTSGAGLSIAAGAELDIGSAGMALTHGIFASPGTLRIIGGLANLAQGLVNDPSGTIITQGGTLLIADRGAHIGTLVQTATAGAASLVTSDYLLALATLDVSGVAVFSGAGATTVANSATIAAAADASATALYLDGGRKLVNRGTLLVGSGSIVLGANPLATASGGGELANMSTGVLDFADGTGVVAGAGTLAFVNSGTLEKLTGSGTATIGVYLRSGGTIHVADGTLLFEAGLKTLARKITVDAGGTIAIGGGTFAVSAGTLGLAGALGVAGGLMDLSHIVTIYAQGGLVLSGGTLALGVRSATVGSLTQSGTASLVTGNGVLTVTGSATFGGTGVQSGLGDTVLQGGGTLLAGARLYLDGRRMLENAGTLIDQGGTILLGAVPTGTASGDGVLSNNGTLLITADGTAVAAGTGYDNVSNSGYLAKTAGTGDSVIAAGLVNLGTVEAASGTLTLGIAGGSGAFEIDNGCVLEFTGMVSSGSIDFLGNAGTLVLDTPAGFSGTIGGFGAGSVIDLAGVSATPTLTYSGTAAGGTLSVSGGGVTASLLFAGNLTTHSFAIAADGHGGVLIA